MALGVLALGAVGFLQWSHATGVEVGALDAFYLSVQLFVLQSGAVPPPVPLALEIARLVAPIVAGYTAISASALLLREQLAALRARRLDGHVVVCGLGRKGALLARTLRGQGRRVAVIERNPENDLIAGARANGTLVFTGDARDPEILRRARVERATHVAAVTGDDGVNAEIAVRVQGLAEDEGRPLTCVVHIVDPQLCVLLRMQEVGRAHDHPFRLEFFNVFEAGARELLFAHPPFAEGLPARVVVVGLGRMGESLVVDVARTWRARGHGGERARIAVVDRVADPKVEALRLRLPKLSTAVDLEAFQMEIGSPAFERADFLFTSDRGPDLSALYVCVDDDSLGLSAALALQRHLRGFDVPVVVRMAHDAGLASLLRGAGDASAEFASLHAFGLLDRTCDADLFLSGMTETLARAMHERYRSSRSGEAADPERNPSVVPWDALPETLRESNRDQATHIGNKLTLLGYALAPLDGWEDEPFAFPPAEVELLGELEHERWVAERLRNGWRFAPGAKDVERKTSPHLVPWTELTEPVREDDRIFVRDLPAFLAEVGYRIVRVRPQDREG